MIGIEPTTFSLGSNRYDLQSAYVAEDYGSPESCARSCSSNLNELHQRAALIKPENRSGCVLPGGEKFTDTIQGRLDKSILYLYGGVMDPVKRAKSILVGAEDGLRKLMQEEISSGRYADISELAALADGVSGLIGKAMATAKNECPDGEVLSSPSIESKGKSSKRTRSLNPGKKTPKKIATKPKGAKRKYPYFESDSAWIVKVGWSKKNKKEYRHNAPRSAATALAKHVDKTQVQGHVWTVEELGEVEDPVVGEVLPSYQLYLIISWMRYNNLILKQGRSSYIAVGGGKLEPSVVKFLEAN